MSMTPYTVISIENVLFGSDSLTDENNLIVFRNVQKYIHHSNRFEWYEIIPCTQDVTQGEKKEGREKINLSIWPTPQNHPNFLVPSLDSLQKFQFIYHLYIEDVHIVWNWYSDEFPSCWT
jgi:hypothetical protein